MSHSRALVVIDAQNEYFGGRLPIEYPPANETLPNIARAMDAAHAAGVPVVVVQHAAPAESPVFARDTQPWRLHDEIASRPYEHRIEKGMPSAFAGTDLADWIARNGIDTLAVAGYMSQHCDASTIYHAYHAGLQVEFLRDASGTLSMENAAGRASAEEIHRVYGVVFQSGFAAVLSTAEWIDALRTGASPERDNPYVSNQRALAGRRAA